MSRDLFCACGETVKVKNYGVVAKKNKKAIQFSSSYDDSKYQCSKCRGIIIPKKKGVRRVSKFSSPITEGQGSSGSNPESKASS